MTELATRSTLILMRDGKIMTFSRAFDYFRVALVSVLVGASVTPSIGWATLILLWTVTDIKNILEDKK